MEQSLSDKERRQRLAIGTGFELAAALTYLNQGTSTVFWIFAIGGLGFIANYFTCFCGTKKAVKTFREKLL